mgnify:CR=1 FL=1
MQQKKRILLLATGGTIASRKSDNGLKPQITPEELIEYIPQVKEICDVEAVQLLNLDSTNMEPSHWKLMVHAIWEHYDDFDGFVIAHGTDTMAYTAAALSYMVQNTKKPIVITGAQKPIDLEITDAKSNLIDSFLYAADDRSQGVQIVFDGKVIAGTRAKKVRSKSYNAFSSINFPYIATIQDEHILFYLDDKELVREPVSFCHTMDWKVGLLKLIPALDAAVLDYMAEHYDAVIIESFGVGGLPNYEGASYHKAVEKWISQGKTVVMTTQVTNEGSNMSVYEVGRTIKYEFGLLESYDMTLEATVTKLMWILGQTREPAGIRRLFYTTIAQDILYNESK